MYPIIMMSVMAVHPVYTPSDMARRPRALAAAQARLAAMPTQDELDGVLTGAAGKLEKLIADLKADNQPAYNETILELEKLLEEMKAATKR